MRTILGRWQERVMTSGDEAAYLVKEAGAWREVSWREAGRRVDELAAGFLALGVGKGDRVAIVGRTRLEWTLSDFALISVGAVVVPLYPTSSAEDFLHVLSDSGTRAVVCEDRAQLEKIEGLRGDVPALEHVIAIEDARGEAVALSDIAERGRELAEARPDAVADSRAAVAAEDVLTLVYTSGTTGPPKGCVLTHRNFAAVCDSVERIEGLVEPGDVALLFLPLAHGFARIVEFLGASLGLTLAFVPDVRLVPRALEEVRPTLFPSVPRLFEKVHGTVQATFAEATGPRRRLVDWALAVGYRASRFRQAARRYPPALALQFALADRLLFSKVKARLGGRMRLSISGGAPLAKEIAEFFHALDILILEGYGLTECGVVASVNRPGHYRFGTVGPPLPGVEVEVADDGEILVRGETVFAGYHGNDEATRDVLTEDGWLRTGDVGAMDGDGFLTIVDRKKEIIVTAGGKNVSPANIENALKSYPFVSHALVVGDARPFVAALLTLDEDAAAKLGDAELERRVEEAVAAVNRQLGQDERVRRWTILPRDFSQEDGEVTPTLKLRRRVIAEHFRDEIEQLYAGRR